jgi:3-hydroxybutyryl-CoA dehydrogenase
VTRTVAVIGAGLMGRGIAQVAATAGCRVLVHDTDATQWPAALDAITASLNKLVDKGKLTAELRDAALKQLEFHGALDALSGADLVIEAIVEQLDAKRELWRRLELLCQPTTVFASNTSSLAIVDQAVGLEHPERLVGLHFFNPVPMMQLVEVVRSVRTAPEVMDRAEAFVRAIGRVPVRCRDESGFVVNRLLVPYLLDAVRVLESGAGSIVDIDTAMTFGAGHPMGPLTLLDFVGLDTVVRIGEIMFDQYRDARFAPPPLLRRMVAAGHLGRKNGRGFYDYKVQPPIPMELGL